MKLNISEEWLTKMAEKEDGCIVSVGGRYIADYYETTIEHLQMLHMNWIFDHPDSKDKDVVNDFVKWAIAKETESLHTPRSKDGKSFFQRREEANKERESPGVRLPHDID